MPSITKKEYDSLKKAKRDAKAALCLFEEQISDMDDEYLVLYLENEEQLKRIADLENENRLLKIENEQKISGLMLGVVQHEIDTFKEQLRIAELANDVMGRLCGATLAVFNDWETVEIPSCFNPLDSVRYIVSKQEFGKG